MHPLEPRRCPKGSLRLHGPVHTRFLLAGLTVVLASCAGQAPPAGGPPDTQPPAIVRTYPDTNAVRVRPDRIELEFNEYVDRRSVQDAVFLSPPLGDLEFDWSGRKVTITFSQSLREGVTYVLAVGTDVVDVRAGIRMASGFTLAFSTGDSIDRGSIEGRVVDDKPEGVMIFAYSLRDVRPDTLNPARARPEYITQTGVDGGFRLSNLAYGPFRVFAVADEYRDLLYAPGTDRYGVAPSDIGLTPSTDVHRHLLFRLAKEDTTSPFVTSVIPLNSSAVEVRFSEPVDSSRFSDAGFSLVDTLDGNSRIPDVVWLDRKDRARSGMAFRTPLQSGRTCEVVVRNVRDDAGNTLREGGGSALFLVPEEADTVAPRVAVEGMPDSARGVSLTATFALTLNEPLERNPFMQGVTIRDSARRPVEFRAEWWNGKDAVIRPVRPLFPAAWYALALRLDSAVDLQGNRGADSLLVLAFRTIDLRTTGEVEGIVTAAPGVPLEGRVIITARKVDSPDRWTTTVSTSGTGPFSMRDLPEGRYAFDAFLDRDSSGVYQPGLPFPYLPAARFTVSPDTVRVRARWTVGDVRIPFR